MFARQAQQELFAARDLGGAVQIFVSAMPPKLIDGVWVRHEQDSEEPSIALSYEAYRALLLLPLPPGGIMQLNVLVGLPPRDQP
jgi:hypothetical protein